MLKRVIDRINWNWKAFEEFNKKKEYNFFTTNIIQNGNTIIGICIIKPHDPISQLLVKTMFSIFTTYNRMYLCCLALQIRVKKVLYLVIQWRKSGSGTQKWLEVEATSLSWYGLIEETITVIINVDSGCLTHLVIVILTLMLCITYLYFRLTYYKW